MEDEARQAVTFGFDNTSGVFFRSILVAWCCSSWRWCYLMNFLIIFLSSQTGKSLGVRYLIGPEAKVLTFSLQHPFRRTVVQKLLVLPSVLPLLYTEGKTAWRYNSRKDVSIFQSRQLKLTELNCTLKFQVLDFQNYFSLCDISVVFSSSYPEWRDSDLFVMLTLQVKFFWTYFWAVRLLSQT